MLRWIPLLFLCFGACRSRPQPEVRWEPVPLQLLPPEQREAVWLPDQVAPYSVGRYVDPRDPNVLHESHTIYRREQTSRPNLAPPIQKTYQSMDAAPAIDAHATLRDALTAELDQQRATSRQLLAQTQAIDQHLRQLNASTQEFRDAAHEYVRLRTQLLAVSNRLDVIERQLQITSSPGAPPPAGRP